MYNFTRVMKWCDKHWVQWHMMDELWKGNFGKIPLEVIFDKYVLRNDEIMLFINCVDEARGEPFEVWEIRPSKVHMEELDFEDEIEVFTEDDWDGQCTDPEILAKDMTGFLRECLVEKKMMLYIPAREKWDMAKLAGVVSKAENEESAST